jgi:phosphoglycolate phosphatase
VGEGARVLVARALADSPPPDLPDLPDLDIALRRFLALYAEVCVATTRPYPGIEEALAVAAARWPLAVVTNKPEALARRVLDHLGLLPRFQMLVGGDTLAVRKPHPEVLGAVARRLDSPLAALLLVGDSGVDARTAAAAGCRLGLVLWGYGEPAELRAATAEFHARNAAELQSELAALARS